MIIPSVDKPLDALLSWAAVREAEFHDHDDPWAVQHNTGLARHVVQNEWCAMASNLSIVWRGEPQQVHYIKRSKLDAVAQAWMDGLLTKKPYFDATRGITKAGSYLQPMRWVESVTAYAVVADMDRFQSLLSWVTHIGKLHHKDFGAVRSFEIVDDPLALTEWSKRNLPVLSPLATNYPRAVGALSAPYWMQSNHRLIAVAP